MNLTVVDDNPFTDLLVQGPDSIVLLTGDASGQFTQTSIVSPGAAGTLAPADGGRVSMQTSFLDTDFAADIVTVAPGTNEVLVFVGDGTDQLNPNPDRYASGGNEPIVARIGSVVGSPFQDVVVGHSDGTVTFFEGVGDGTLIARPDLTVTGLGDIFDMTINDFDGDGDDDVAVSGGSQVTILSADDDPLTLSPITNGDFSSALTGWNSEVVGHNGTQTPGRVSALGGFAQLYENESFLVSVNQTFEVPPNPQTITFDIESLGLDEIVAGNVPDAFEVSLLDAANASVVPTHEPSATSFFNANPNDDISLASGVTFDGRTATLDISSVAAGTEVTLYFDLIGNPPGTSSVASIDNVTISPDFITADTTTNIPLAGPFTDAAGITSNDVDGDGNIDIVVADAGANSLVVFNGDGLGNFTRDEFDTSGLGSAPTVVTSGILTAGDEISDLATTLAGSSLVITPIVPDDGAPTGTLVDPDASQPIVDPVTAITVEFSEPMRDSGSGGNNSVSNPAAYTVTEVATSSTIAVTSATYDPVANEVVLQLDAGSTPLDDGMYQVTLEGDDAVLALEDISGNALGMGQDQVFTFTVNNDGPIFTGSGTGGGPEGSTFNAGFGFSDVGGVGPYTATIDWGDNSSDMVVPVFASDNGTIDGTHIYADNGSYPGTVTVTDGLGRSASTTFFGGALNADPTVTPAAMQTIDEDTLLSLDVATFTDPGFTDATAGTSETFTAEIDWGDNSPIDTGNLTVTQGARGTDTTGIVNGNHVYFDPGTYTVTVTVQDDDGDPVEAMFDVTVESTNVAPTVSVGNVSGDEGEAVSVSATFNDPGDPGGHNATISWGDGTTSTGIVTFDPATGNGTVTGDHIYADDGSYTVTVSVVDAQQAGGQDSTNSSIANVSPTVTPSANQSSDTGCLLYTSDAADE